MGEFQENTVIVNLRKNYIVTKDFMEFIHKNLVLKISHKLFFVYITILLYKSAICLITLCTFCSSSTNLLFMFFFISFLIKPFFFNLDVEHEVRCLRRWVKDMEARLQPLNFQIEWTLPELEKKALEHMVSSYPLYLARYI